MLTPASPQTVLVISTKKSLSNKISKLIKAGFPSYSVEIEDSGRQGLTRIYQCPPDFIIVDSALCDISGLQICRVLKHDPVLRKLPLMLITQGEMKEYDRYGELSIIADAFIDEKSLPKTFHEDFEMLITLFQGLNPSELEQLTLLRESPVQVQALNRLVQLYDQSITEAMIMKGFNKLFESIPHKNILYHMLFNLIENILDYDIAGLFFYEKGLEAPLMTYHVAQNVTLKENTLELWTKRIFDDIKACAPEFHSSHSPQYEVIIPEHLEPSIKPLNIKSHALYPFFIESQFVGAIVFLNQRETHYDLIFPFKLLLQELSALMRLRYYYASARLMEISDALTGLYTHQHFLWCLEREIRQSKRHQSPVTLALFSIENIKALNHQWGHAAVDKMLQHLSQVLLANLRNIDLLARSGSRSVLILMPQTTPELAQQVIFRIQKVLHEVPFAWEDQTINWHLSIGVAGLQEHIHNASDFILQAQAAVEQARQKGQNAVELLQ